MASGMFPGKGAPLYLASSNPREPVWLTGRSADPDIPSGSSSIGIPVNPGLTTSINVLFASAPTEKAFNVMYDIDPTFANEIVLQAIAATADTLYVWSTNGMIELDGFIRITNVGGENIREAYLQQRSTTVG